MDGIHDLGGKQGFGPVEVDHEYVAFQHDWEARVWAVASTCDSPEWTLDWWRHIMERIEPPTYLTAPYFEKWCLTYLAAFITSGVFSLDEALSGLADRNGVSPATKSLGDVLEEDRASVSSFRCAVQEAPRFSRGQSVVTLRDVTANHTRLPAYARGRSGQIVALNGAHPLPDLGASGVHEPQHLYTVMFMARELWGPEAGPNDTVRLDLWESYLVPA